MPKDWEKYGDQYLKLFADCIPVKGAKNSAVYDLTRHEIISFPTEYYSILKSIEGKKLLDILQMGKHDHGDLIANLLEFLDDNELIMLVENPDDFPPMASEWDYPAVIQNAVIDVSSLHHDFSKIFDQLDCLGCQHVQIRCFTDLLSINNCEQLLAAAKDKSIAGVELILRYEVGASEDLYIAFMRRYPMLATLTVHSAPASKMIVVESHPSKAYDGSPLVELTFTTQVIDSELHCGIISPRQFTPPSVSSFFEAVSFNGCLNRKISVDVMGNIKNCPSMSVSFGSISDTSLVDVAREEGLQRHWFVSKDDVLICQDCEFRYACSDCRAYVEDPSNPLSKPLKCGYDPYNGVWATWSGDLNRLAAAKLYQIQVSPAKVYAKHPPQVS